MGAWISHAAAPPPPPPAAYPAGIATIIPPAAEEKPEKKTDYLNLPCPVGFEEIQRESSNSLKLDLFEGLQFGFSKGLNQKFALSHSLLMGSMEVPQQSSDIIKVPTAHYEFGVNFADDKSMLIGRILTDGRVTAQIKHDLTENLIMKIHAQLTNEPHFSQGVFMFDYKGKDFRSQFQFGNNALYGANYIQSLTPNLSLGSEIVWLGHQRKSVVGFGARYNTDKMIAAGHVTTAGTIALSYVQKVSEKVSLASDFIYNQITRDVTASVGYDYMLHQCRLRGKFDSNGCVAALLEEQLSMGVRFSLSAEVDHRRKDYKFGIGFNIGN